MQEFAKFSTGFALKIYAHIKIYVPIKANLYNE